MKTPIRLYIHLILLWLLSAGALPITWGEDAHEGALVLAFDDGFANWLEVVAPELQAVGGKGTAFVNNQYIPSRVSFDDLRRLRDEFGWEIGTHAFHHHNARTYTRAHGLVAWERDQLKASLEQLEAAGLRAEVLAFPFNVFDDALAKTALRHVRSYRRAVPLALMRSPPSDGSHPATSIDVAAYVPPRMLESWVNLAAETRATLSLYAHRVLPDEQFQRGIVQTVGADHLVCELPLADLAANEVWMLVPDVDRRLQRTSGLIVSKVEGNIVHVEINDLSSLTRPGATFMIGPASSTRLSDFRALLQKAHEKKLRFLTVSESIRIESDTP